MRDEDKQQYLDMCPRVFVRALRDPNGNEEFELSEGEATDLLRRRERRDWQPIETAPKDGTWVLLWNDDAIFTGHFTKYWMFVEPVEHPIVGAVRAPTHWKPLDVPPGAVLKAAHDGKDSIR